MNAFLQLPARYLMFPLALLLVALFSAGCPGPPDEGDETGKLTLVMTTGEEVAKGNNKDTLVPESDIESLVLTVESVELLRDGADPVAVFTGPQDINLLDLVGVSQVFDTAIIPSGTYTSVRMTISGALLERVSILGTVFDVSLPDAGVLTIPVNVVIENDGEGLLTLNLGSINLFELDDLSYAFTLDVTAGLSVEPVQAQAIGKVEDLDETGGTFTVRRGNAQIPVVIGSALIFLPTDFDSASGTAADLATARRVLVLGTLNADGTLSAQVIVIFAGEQEEDDDDGDDDREVVTILDSAFDPADVTIREGKTVRWRSATETDHSVSLPINADGDVMDIPFLDVDDIAEIRFEELRLEGDKDEASVNTPTVGTAHLRIRVDGESTEVEEAPFRVDEGGNAVFDYFSNTQESMTGTVTVAPKERHGDDDEEDRISICHVNGNGGSRTIRVSRSALQAHLDHGDSEGSCEGEGEGDGGEDDGGEGEGEGGEDDGGEGEGEGGEGEGDSSEGETEDDPDGVEEEGVGK